MCVLGTVRVSTHSRLWRRGPSPHMVNLSSFLSCGFSVNGLSMTHWWRWWQRQVGHRMSNAPVEMEGNKLTMNLSYWGTYGTLTSWSFSLGTLISMMKLRWSYPPNYTQTITFCLPSITSAVSCRRKKPISKRRRCWGIVYVYSYCTSTYFDQLY